MLQELERIAYCTLVPVVWYLAYFYWPRHKGKPERWRLRTMLYSALAGFLVGLVWAIADYVVNH